MLNSELVRAHFPALATGATFFDNPGGTQVAQEVITRMQQYYMQSNANNGGAFRTSVVSDAIVGEARQAIAHFLNAARAEEIIFGQNMTSLTMHISRSLARWLQPGDELVVTRLDHDANIAPWLLIAEDRGCVVRWLDIRPEDCTLDLEALSGLVNERTKIVAVGYASNAVGTINDVKRVVEIAHGVGALCFVDAVQYAPHKSIDVQELNCDFLACSAYKFFGPHTGILYGKYDLLERLTAYKVRPSHNEPPHKFETGTQSFESIAGVLGTLEYLTWVGATFGSGYAARFQDRYSGRGLLLRQAFAVIEEYELEFNRVLVKGLGSVRGLRLLGITDEQRLGQRVPTFSFALEGWKPRMVAERLAQENIYVWDGNFYALAVIERLGFDPEEGVVRVGLTHYNTMQEVERLVHVLTKMVG